MKGTSERHQWRAPTWGRLRDRETLLAQRPRLRSRPFERSTWAPGQCAKRSLPSLGSGKRRDGATSAERGRRGRGRILAPSLGRGCKLQRRRDFGGGPRLSTSSSVAARRAPRQTPAGGVGVKLRDPPCDSAWSSAPRMAAQKPPRVSLSIANRTPTADVTPRWVAFLPLEPLGVE